MIIILGMPAFAQAPENHTQSYQLDNPMSVEYLKKNLRKSQPRLVLNVAIEKNLQEKLKTERKKQALLDVEEAKKIIESLKGKTFETKTKVDAEGHMYGSVSQTDIVKLLKENGIEIDKRMVRIPGAIKSLGDHTISLHLKEGVLTDFVLKVLPEEEQTPTEPEPKT